MGYSEFSTFCSRQVENSEERKKERVKNKMVKRDHIGENFGVKRLFVCNIQTAGRSFLCFTMNRDFLASI